VVVGRSADRAVAIGDPVVYAAGDIACDPAGTNFNGGMPGKTACQSKWTADIIAGQGDATAAIALGDNQYYCGSAAAYQQSYNLANGWGQFKATTYPVVGNHEYIVTAGAAGTGSTGCDAGNAKAAGYSQYFGSAAHASTNFYYYVDPAPGWRLIVLNSNCRDMMLPAVDDGCKLGSAQETWLKTKALAAPLPPCIVAVFHHPLYNQGQEPAAVRTQPLWADLYAARADLVLNGHEHAYERYMPMDANGHVDPAGGITEIVAGTGGANHTQGVVASPGVVVNDHTSFGVLRLVLHPTSWESNFLPTPGSTLTGDPAQGTCHDVSVVRPVATTLPATALGDTTATLNAQVDPNGASTTYEFEYGITNRYGSTTAPTTANGAGARAVSSAIAGLAPGTLYHYRVDAINGGGTTLGADAAFTTTGKAVSAPSSDHSAPLARIHVPQRPTHVTSWRLIRGTVSDAPPSSGIAKVEVNLIRRTGARCAVFNKKLFARLRCKPALNAWVKATIAHGRWSLRVIALRPGRYTLRARATDAAGNVQSALGPASSLSLRLH
jgi:hypothetical protein